MIRMLNTTWENISSIILLERIRTSTMKWRSLRQVFTKHSTMVAWWTFLKTIIIITTMTLVSWVMDQWSWAVKTLFQWILWSTRTKLWNLFKYAEDAWEGESGNCVCRQQQQLPAKKNITLCWLLLWRILTLLLPGRRCHQRRVLLDHGNMTIRELTDSFSSFFHFSFSSSTCSTGATSSCGTGGTRIWMTWTDDYSVIVLTSDVCVVV